MDSIKTLTGNPDLVKPGFEQPPENPLFLLQQWLVMAEQLQIVEPRGFVLSTVDVYGKPSSRVVLVKTVDDSGVVFASSEHSHKGIELSKNPVASGTLWWRESVQQINFFGTVTKLAAEISDDIFLNRTREAQAVAALSHQSATMTDEINLRAEIKKLVNQSGKIVRPTSWCAYHISLKTIEFWHGAQNRFHDRLRYDLKNGVWYHQKLQP
jgi:pyridoxamine-phosphate oxidase